ncbi:helicase-related protein [Paraliomyxa miuraensis]|uniref:helicase-related protein n=1 Tax=Paraliomyxa miuraensis TaxID=376150 RepID=UPI00225BB90E|nr:helicase-related protein [Paraliomyxa miuraensis]MCX4239433.1 helicase-related protein [Paraliomyxa miuraensis]
MTDDTADETWEQIQRPRRGRSRHRQEVSAISLPQQEDLSKVVRVVELAHLDDVSLGRAIASLGARPKQEATARNVMYYRRNARLLRLTDDNDVPTPAGRALLRLDPDEKIMRLSHAFEGSDVGRAWMQWARVTRLEQLEPGSAPAFVTYIREQQGQSDNATWKRRTTTLRLWCERFQQCRRQHDGLLKDPPHRESPLPTPPHATTAVLDRGTALTVVRALSKGASHVDVATAYFSLHGYHDLMSQLERADLRLLIGANDQARDQLAELLRVFAASLEANFELSLAQMRGIAVRLHRQLVRGRVRVRYFEPRELESLHAKVFIFDRNRAYVTSSNLTSGGLRTNIECGYQVMDADEAGYLHGRFEHYFERARPLSEPIIAKIERSWAFWGFGDPHLVFLKILDTLFGHLPRVKRIRYDLAEFQRAIVATLLARLESRRRLMLIAPTGMGKTIMAGYVARALMERGEIGRVVIACKNGSIFEMWQEALRSFGISADRVRVYDLERTRDGGEPGEGSSDDLTSLFRSLDERDLIIVDECHHFRRRAAKRQVALGRFLAGPRPDVTGPRALLMTATPISTGLKNLQTLASLVGDDSIEALGDVAVADGIVNIALGPILRDFGVEEGRWIRLRFGEVWRYFPHVEVRTVHYRSCMSTIFRALADMDFSLARDSQDYAWLGVGDDDVEDLGGRHGVIRALLARRAESSPSAFSRTLESLRQGLAQHRLRPVDRPRFEAQLDELVASMRAVDIRKDPKLHELMDLIRRRRPGDKILIFTEYRATAELLHDAIGELVEPRLVGLITGELSNADRKSLFRRFAPMAQRVEEPLAGASVEILVATDAIAEGENLQDARIVINYDVSWTPLRLIQRVGRVDRFTTHKRWVKVRNFFPGDDCYEQIVDLWGRLEERASQQEMFSGTNVVGNRVRRSTELAQADIELMETLYRGELDTKGLYEQATAQMPPTTLFERLWSADVDALERARALPDGIQARIAGDRPGLYVLLRHEGRATSLFRPEGELAWREAPRECSHEQLLMEIRVKPGSPVLDPRTPLDAEVDALVRSWLDARALAGRRLRVLAAFEICHR